MTSQQENFVNDYLKHVFNGDAAVFAGAGLSVGAGFVDWRGLLRDIAKEIELEIDKETDLISLAQFHVNERGGRGGLNQKIIEEFTEKIELTANHRILARLPIHTYWTTNYDSLIEDALFIAGKRVDKKFRPVDIPFALFKRDAVVYKMHGDAQHPQDAILTKDDYEQYHRKNEAFITTLSSDLISKTFLFIGFSFTDPNLDYILSRVKLSLTGSTRPHYCIIKKVNPKDFTHTADYEYSSRRQALMISDLKRFQIQSVLIDEYAEITELLLELESRFKRTTVFISGSAQAYAPHEEHVALEFVHQLSKQIIKDKYAIVNGFGLGIGSAVINGALDAIYSNPNKYGEDQLILRPFPQLKTGSKDLKELWREYRQKMISFAGVALFLFGNKIDPNSGEVINAPGVKQEFDIAIQNGLLPIPIGSTGSATSEISKNVMTDYDKYFVGLPDLRDLLLSLNDTDKALEEHIPTVLKILKIINRR